MSTNTNKLYYLATKDGQTVLDPCSFNIYGPSDRAGLVNAGLTFGEHYINEAKQHASQIVKPKFYVTEVPA